MRAENTGLTAARMMGGEPGWQLKLASYTILWYNSGKIEIEGPGFGAGLRFVRLRCPSCRDKPPIVQALNFVKVKARKRGLL